MPRTAAAQGRADKAFINGNIYTVNDKRPRAEAVKNGRIVGTTKAPPITNDKEKNMSITGFAPQLRTTDLAASIRFYTEKLGFAVEFRYEDFYAGIRAGGQVFHLKLVDEPDPYIPYVANEGFHLYFKTEGVAALAAKLKADGVPLVKDVHETAWGTREAVINDDQGHTLYLGESL